jgi:YidC/Oxa1 family membrane protein insertase
MSLTTYISQRQLMSKQTAQVNPQQQTIMKIMPLMFFVFAVNVPLAVIIYWVTTNFWSVGQQYMLLKTHPLPATATAGGQAAPAGAAAAVDNEGRRSLGPLSMFRGLTLSRATGERSPTANKNGDRNAKAGDGKPPPKRGGAAAKQGGAAAKQGGAAAKEDGAAAKQGGPAAKGAAQARPGQRNRQGTSGNRRSGSRSSGKGKSSGPRRGKR